MKIIYDQRFASLRYSDDNAASPGRMEAAMSGLLNQSWEIIAPREAEDRQLLMVHSGNHLRAVRQDGPRFFLASLAAGGAILAARLAYGGEPSFACVRPPGHHASREQTWGHCTFNNIAIALQVLREEKRIERAFVLDFDAHTGDGTRVLLSSWSEVFNPFAPDAGSYLAEIEDRLANLDGADILAVSAGFDGYKLDVGHKLGTGDFEQIGKMAARAAKRLCRGRRFAVLEGGYYLKDLGENVLAFCRGFAE